MQPTKYILTIFSRQYWGIIIFLLIVLPFIAYSFPFLFDLTLIKSTIKSQFVVVVVFYLFSYLLLQEIVWLTAKVQISVDSEELTIARFFCGICFKKKYEISKISNLHIEHNVPTNWRLGRGNNGFSLIKEPTILFYDYERKTQCIGKHLKDFPAESILKEVELRKKYS